MSPTTLCEGGVGVHLHHPQCLPLPWWDMGTRAHLHHTQSHSLWMEWVGLICIIHSVSPSSLGGDRGAFTSQCITLRWRWGKGSFTVLFPLLLVEVREGLICIIHSVSPSTGGGWA